ncbi:MAG: hypothetical protein M5U28_11485 [Sandaracinaceae bacterium]|nr:hypothetical protein [Sandaracinaceae bacterium]
MRPNAAAPPSKETRKLASRLGAGRGVSGDMHRWPSAQPPSAHSGTPEHAPSSQVWPGQQQPPSSPPMCCVPASLQSNGWSETRASTVSPGPAFTISRALR